MHDRYALRRIYLTFQRAHCFPSSTTTKMLWRLNNCRVCTRTAPLELTFVAPTLVAGGSRGRAVLYAYARIISMSSCDREAR